MKNKWLNRIITILIFLYFIFKPMYLFPSGMIQVADCCLMLIFFIIRFFPKNRLISNEKSNKINRCFSCLYLFLIWVIFINGIWSFYLNDFSLLKSILFYVFNLLAIWVIKELYFMYGNNIFYKIVKFVGISCIVQVMLTLLLTVSTGRATVLFNNPNQLGLYALISLTYVLMLSKFISKKVLFINGKLFLVLSIISACYLILISLSKAAIIGAVVLLIIYFLVCTKLYKTKLILILLALIIMLFNIESDVIEKIQETPIFNTAINRIGNIAEEEDSDLGAGRGYDRIKEIGLQVLYGTGEGANYRFEVMNGSEIHSAYASLLCYYGIIGVGLFLVFFIKSFPFKIEYFKYYILFIGIILYGFTHQIWRNTLLWILLEIVVIVCLYEIDMKNKFHRKSKL